MTLTQAYILLIVAILCEVVATGSLKATDGFTKLAPAAISVIAISVCMFLMAHVMQILPIGITYATWSAVGIVALSLVGIFKYKEIPNIPTIIGLTMIVIGVIIVNTMHDAK